VLSFNVEPEGDHSSPAKDVAYRLVVKRFDCSAILTSIQMRQNRLVDLLERRGDFGKFRMGIAVNSVYRSRCFKQRTKLAADQVKPVAS
jgi:hypothetical protein